MFSFEASQVIYAGGAILAGIEMAKIGERIAELDVAKSRQEVRFMLTGYYLDLVKLQNQIQVIDRHIELTNKVLDQMRAREAAGVVLRNDLTRYELQLKQLELTRIRLLDAQSIIHHQLTTALHRDGQTIVPDTLSVNAALAQLEQAASEQLWQSRAAGSHLGIQQAEAAQQLSEQQVKMTRSASIPHIALVAKDEMFGPYTSDLIPVNANVNAWFVGIGLQYDLGSLWHNHRAIRKAKTERKAAQERVELAREGVNNGVHAAYTHFLTAFTEVETQEKQVQLADENYALVEKRYNNELALLTDLLDASSMKLQADMALVNARVGLLYQFYQLKYTTHTL
jgi:outer membrane protein TolC